MQANRLFLLLALMCAATSPIFAQANIAGKWWDQDKKGQTELYIGATGTLYGKVVMLTTPNDPKTGKPQLDIHNTDAKLRSRPNMGMIVLMMTEKGKGVWQGTVYNPKDGYTYSGKLTALPDGTLSLRGYVGISLIGKTEIWTRVK